MARYKVAGFFNVYRFPSGRAFPAMGYPIPKQFDYALISILDDVIAARTGRRAVRGVGSVGEELSRGTRRQVEDEAEVADEKMLRETELDVYFTMLPYGEYKEWGTVKARATPFLRPALELYRERIEALGGEILI